MVHGFPHVAFLVLLVRLRLNFPQNQQHCPGHMWVDLCFCHQVGMQSGQCPQPMPTEHSTIKRIKLEMNIIAAFMEGTQGFLLDAGKLCAITTVFEKP